MKIQRILFITESPISFDLNGASTFSTGHFAGLLYAFPTALIHLVFLNDSEISNAGKLELLIKDAGFTGQIAIHHIPSQPLTFKVIPFKSLLSFNRNTILRKAERIFTNNSELIIEQVKLVVDKFKPDIIWAEHFYPALIGTQIASTIPLAYSHHDYLFRILRTRNKFSLKNLIRSTFIRSLEIKLIRHTHFFINGSEKEKAFALKINPQLKALMFPAIYPEASSVFKNSIVQQAGQLTNRIVHIGGLSGTANRIGLSHFLRHIYPRIKKNVPQFEFHIIGNKTLFDNKEWEWAQKDPHIFIHGHVIDLTTVLQPFDVHVIPYHKATGTRTRFMNAIRYHGCVVIFDKNIIRNIGNHELNGILVAKHPHAFADHVIRVLQAPADRIRLANLAHETYQSQYNFTTLSQQLKLLFE